MAHMQTPFLPQVNGFHFVNRFDALPEINLPIIGPVDLGEKIIGLCGGMSFAALDYMSYAIPIPAANDPSQIDPALRSYLIQRQLDSLSIFVLHRVISWMLRSDADVLAFTGREAPRIQNAINSGQPVTLCLVRVAGLTDPTANHQVLAVAYDFDPQHNHLDLYLYDPNHPGEEPVIAMDLDSNGGAANLAQSTGEPLRALFAIPYTAQHPPVVP